MFFLVFEGLDGSGKSSLMKSLDVHLKSKNYETVLTREPGGTELGDRLRDLILQKTENKSLMPVPRAELLMYQASRAQHVEFLIKPALEQKKWVLCDRFSASSLAFQGGGRGIPLADVHWLNQFATDQLRPHLTILLDLSVQESEKRRQKRSQLTGEPADRIESEAAFFHERVRQGFLSQAKDDPDGWLVLDASLSQQELFEKLITFLQSKKWLA